MSVVLPESVASLAVGVIAIVLALAGWLGTMLSARERRSEERLDDLRLRALTGYGAERAAEVTA
jgi:hypothetical protein